MSFVAEAVRQFFILKKKGLFRLKDWHQIASFTDDTLSRGKIYSLSSSPAKQNSQAWSAKTELGN